MNGCLEWVYLHPLLVASAAHFDPLVKALHYSYLLISFYHTQTIGAMASTASLQSAMQGILQNCTQTQINQLIEALQAAQPRNAEIAAPNAASTMTARAGVTTAKNGKKQRDKKAKSDRATGGPKRPLNSWMAFRKYYSASLAPHTQKTISKVLTSWWREDPFEAKW